jgi:hypothetical protein
LDRILALEAVRVTEAAAIRAAKLVGRGDEHAADQAAVEGMRWAFNHLPIEGVVVIGEGERDEAPMLFIGELVGSGGIKVDIALDRGGHHADGEGAAQRACRDGDGRSGQPAQRARCVHGQDRDRPRLQGRHD